MIKIYDRNVEVPEDEKNIGFEGDNNVHTVLIKIFNTWLSNFDFKIDVMGRSKNIMEPTKEIYEDGILLSWEIKKEHIQRGILYAQVRALSESEQIWHSDIFELNVKASINAADVFPNSLPSEFEEMEKRVVQARNETVAARENIENFKRDAEVAKEKSEEAQKKAEEAKETAVAAAASAENTKEQIENEISAIEAALDKYITAQNALIGGDGK